MIYIDSNVAIGLIHGNNQIKEVLEKIDDQTSLAITTPSIYEIYFGYYYAKYSKKLKKTAKSAKYIEAELIGIEKLLKTLVHRDLDGKSAKLSAELYNILSSKGEKIEPFDCLIAGIILSNNDKDLITYNTKHFERIPNLNLIKLISE
jgi:predicted nucleic acid-binding protein